MAAPRLVRGLNTAQIQHAIHSLNKSGSNDEIREIIDSLFSGRQPSVYGINSANSFIETLERDSEEKLEENIKEATKENFNRLYLGVGGRYKKRNKSKRYSKIRKNKRKPKTKRRKSYR
jgi:predicted house-cleaning noncanonical NTP pyrophosphatase (MazG superfamily)